MTYDDFFRATSDFFSHVIKSILFSSPVVYSQVINAIESDDNNADRQKSNTSATTEAGTLRRNGGLMIAIPKNDSFSEEVHYRKHPRPVSHIESKSSPGVLVPRPYNRVTSYQPSVGGMSSHSEADHNIPPPSTDKEKSKHTR